jgi:hypothetical protein
MSVFVSNCGPRGYRNLVLDELMNLLPDQIDSYGSCKNNADPQRALIDLDLWDKIGEEHSRWNQKITLLQRYKFAFALENSNDIDYVTESLSLCIFPCHSCIDAGRHRILPGDGARFGTSSSRSVVASSRPRAALDIGHAPQGVQLLNLHSYRIPTPP